jgi:LPXTG-motif cell wall-anchored protein
MDDRGQPFATLLFAPAAMANSHTAQMMDYELMSTSTATATSMSTASAMDDKLPNTGGPSLAPAFVLLAGLMLMGSGVAAFALVRRATS